MSVFQSLRQSRSTIRTALAWFVVALGLAVLAPAWAPRSLPGALTDVCSATGTPAQGSADASGPANGQPPAHSLHCVFCLPTALPAPTELAFNPQVVGTGVLPTGPFPAVGWRGSGPTSARDPPTLI